MVVGCPYILIPCRTQLSGLRFPCLSIFIFNRLARLLSAKPSQIDRKWDYLSHLRTRNLRLLVPCRVGLLRPTAPELAQRAALVTPPKNSAVSSPKPNSASKTPALHQ